MSESVTGSSSPAPVLSYATPFSNQPAGLWRDGKLVVAHQSAAFPDRCAKCNAPAEGWRWNRKLWWHHPAFYLMIIFPGLLIYLIVALFVRKSAKVSIPLCPRHRAIRRNAVLIGWVFGMGGLICMFAGFYALTDRAYRNSDAPPYMLLGGFIAAFFGLLWGNFRGRVVMPTKIDGEYVWLRGAGSKFLEDLPPARPPQ